MGKILKLNLDEELLLASILNEVLSDNKMMDKYDVNLRGPRARKYYKQDINDLKKVDITEGEYNPRRPIVDMLDDYFPIGHEPFRDQILARVRRAVTPNDPEYTTVRISKNLKKKLTKLKIKMNMDSLEDVIASFLARI